jgi:hypothetical protein
MNVNSRSDSDSVSAELGSSNRNSSALATNARASAVNWRTASEQLASVSPAWAPMPSCSSTSSSSGPGLGRAVGEVSRPIMRFSPTVMVGNSCGSWCTTVTLRGPRTGSHGSPPQLRLPASTSSWPSSIRTSVLLPAPLGPAMPRISPGRMSSSMPASACVDP